MMGGSIELTSEPGRGSTFRFAARFERQKVTEEAVAPSPFEGMAVLVVENNLHHRRDLKDQLSSWGIRVGEAEDGASALAEIAAAAARADPFGMAIIDITLPDTNGIDLVREIKSNPAIAGLRLVLLTSRDFEIDQHGDLRKQVAGCLTKPVRQAALRRCFTATDGAGDAAAPPRLAEPAPDGATGAPVLLVEDNPVNLEVAVAMLESFGCKVTTGVNGKEALERYASGEFNLIFMDCQMPEMDGFEATAEIRRQEAGTGRSVPIIALTASAIEGDRERCLAAGMNDYVPKPFTADQMRSVVATWIGRSARGTANGKRNHLTLVSPAETPPAAATPGGPIDDRVLSSLARLQRDGRPDIVSRVIMLFLESTPALVTDLEEGAATGDMAVIHRASHTLKSASANVGASVLSAHCKDLEAMARAGAVPDALSRVATIIEDYRRAHAALTALLPQVA
jgi:CheY-like chemotaxis protein